MTVTDVSPSIAARLSEMAAEILDLRAKLARVLAVPSCRDAGHTEALHIAAGCCDPYESPCAALRSPRDEACDYECMQCSACAACDGSCGICPYADQSKHCCYDGLRPREYPRCTGPQRAAGSGRAEERPAEDCPNCTEAYACGPCVWNAGPYTEDEIREAFEALGDETNQDDLMYRLHWSFPQRADQTQEGDR